MKWIAAITLLVSCASASPSLAQRLDVKTLTCKEFMGLPPDTVDKLSIWLDGLTADEDDLESMRVDVSDMDADDIKDYCAKNPSIGLLQALEKVED